MGLEINSGFINLLYNIQIIWTILTVQSLILCKLRDGIFAMIFILCLTFSYYYSKIVIIKKEIRKGRDSYSEILLR